MKVFAVIMLCLVLSVVLYGIAGADSFKKKGEEMINVNRTLDIDEKAALIVREEAVDEETELTEEAAEMAEIHELADETMKQTEKQ